MPSIVERFRYAHLLAMLVIVLLGRPFMAEISFFDAALTEVLLPATFLLAILACARSRLQAWIGIMLLLGMQGTRLVALTTDSLLIDSSYPLLGFAFAAYISGIILHRIFVATTEVTIDTIVGAITVYLLAGVAWAFAFFLMEQALPGSFVYAGEPLASIGVESYMSFSFITITTLGYGNVIPVGERAAALAYSEAIFGQLYLTILVARLIGVHLAQARR
jgi:hypothetical protein